MTKDELIEQLAKAEFEREGLVLCEANRQTTLYATCHRFATNAMPLIVAFVDEWLDEKYVDGTVNIRPVTLRAAWKQDMA